MATRALGQVVIKIIKLNENIIAPFISQNLNTCFDKGVFPKDLRHLDIFPVHEKKPKTNKANYRPVSTLSNFPKLHEN